MTTPHEYIQSIMVSLTADGLIGAEPILIPSAEGMAIDGYVSGFCWCDKPWCAFCAYNAPEALIPIPGILSDMFGDHLELRCYKHYGRSFTAKVIRTMDETGEGMEIPLTMEHVKYAEKCIRAAFPTLGEVEI